MNINEKIELINTFNSNLTMISDLIYTHPDDKELLELEEFGIDISNKEYKLLTLLPREYNFFESLHIQSKYDDVISLMKIAERLNVTLDTYVNIENIHYDEIWETINVQIPVDKSIINFIEKSSDIIGQNNDWWFI